MKNDTTLFACAVVITLETQKHVEKGHLAPSNLTFLLVAIDTNGFRKMKEEGKIYKTLPQSFSFLPGDSVVIFQSLVMILARFFDFERP